MVIAPRLALPLAVLLLAACGGSAPFSPGPAEEVLPGGLSLARGGLARDGRRVVVLAASPDGPCRRVEVWRRELDGWRAAASARPPTGSPCPFVSARLSPDAGTLAVYDQAAGEVALSRIEAGALEAHGSFRLDAAPGLAFPAPGANLAFANGGRLLLVGALGRACRRSQGELLCGVAELAERTTAGWRGLETLRPTDEAAATVRFGQAVALTADGSLALVGGTGQPGRSGALWMFARGDGPARTAGVLRPDRADPWFGNDLALSADGIWLAVGGERVVYLFERAGDGFALRRRLTAPDASAGYFGETVALSGDGRTLLIGAPRAACAAGERCGRAYLYRREEAWTSVAAIGPAAERAEANFAHRLAIDPAGAFAAVQGAGLHIFTLHQAPP